MHVAAGNHCTFLYICLWNLQLPCIHQTLKPRFTAKSEDWSFSLLEITQIWLAFLLRYTSWLCLSSQSLDFTHIPITLPFLEISINNYFFATMTTECDLSVCLSLETWSFYCQHLRKVQLSPQSALSHQTGVEPSRHNPILLQEWRLNRPCRYSRHNKSSFIYHNCDDNWKKSNLCMCGR